MLVGLAILKPAKCTKVRVHLLVLSTANPTNITFSNKNIEMLCW